MELKKRISPGKIFVGLYILAFLVYLSIGLQPAEAAKYDTVSSLSIPSIGLTSDVVSVEPESDGYLKTPDTVVGEYFEHSKKKFLFGHSSTVFAELVNVQVGDLIEYGAKNYKIISKAVMKKENIDMEKVLAEEKEDTLIIMTCAGKDLGEGDATHRLLVTAVVK